MRRWRSWVAAAVGGSFGGSGGGGASLGRVLLMASLRFGQSKEPSQLMAPASSRGLLASQLMALSVRPARVLSLRRRFGDSGEDGASLGRVLLMASLRFGHQKNRPNDGTRCEESLAGCKHIFTNLVKFVLKNGG